MSELSIHELQAETVELLPERETLGAVVITQGAVTEANQVFTAFSLNNAGVAKSANVVALGSFNNHFGW